MKFMTMAKQKTVIPIRAGGTARSTKKDSQPGDTRVRTRQLTRGYISRTNPGAGISNAQTSKRTKAEAGIQRTDKDEHVDGNKHIPVRNGGR